MQQTGPERAEGNEHAQQAHDAMQSVDDDADVDNEADEVDDDADDAEHDHNHGHDRADAAAGRVDRPVQSHADADDIDD